MLCISLPIARDERFEGIGRLDYRFGLAAVSRGQYRRDKGRERGYFKFQFANWVTSLPVTSSQILLTTGPSALVATATENSSLGAIQTTKWFIVLEPAWVSTPPWAQLRCPVPQPMA